MAAEIDKERWKHLIDKPFQPFHDPRVSVVADAAALRSAHALEYIAAQLGQINERLRQLEQTQGQKIP
jgi:hypothetical protein